MKLWMGNIEPGTTDQELIDLVKKYAPDLTCKKVERVEGTGSRPGAILEFEGGKQGALETVSLRLNGIFWKNRELVCQKIAF